MGQRLQLHGGSHTTSLIGVGFHEFHAGGGVEKQVTDNDGSAIRTTGLVFFCDHTGFQMQRNATDGVSCFRQNIDAADGGNGSQSFATEAKGFDSSQIFCGAQLAGCVALKGGAGIIGGHTAAIIGDAQEGHTAILDLHRYFGGTGVHCVFQ